MRNLSMKKFGTPTGTAPGSASEVVGFVTVGTPRALRSATCGAASRWGARSGETVRCGVRAVAVVVGHGVTAAFVPAAAPWPRPSSTASPLAPALAAFEVGSVAAQSSAAGSSPPAGPASPLSGSGTDGLAGAAGVAGCGAAGAAGSAGAAGVDGAAGGTSEVGAVTVGGVVVVSSAGAVTVGAVVVSSGVACADAAGSGTWACDCASGATCVGAATTCSPGTAGSSAPAPSRLPLSATATRPAVHSAAAMRARLVRCVVPSGLAFMSGGSSPWIRVAAAVRAIGWAIGGHRRDLEPLRA